MFKRILIGLIVLLMFTTVASAEIVWVAANQRTVRWDAVTKLENGKDIPADNTIKYRIYTKSEDGTVTQVGETDTDNYTVTLQNEGRYVIGVQAVRYDKDGKEVSKSTISWSDNPDAVLDTTFGISYFVAPASPTGLSY